MKKISIWIIGIIIIVGVAGLVIPIKTIAPKDTRVILEHTHETFIAPPCFDQSDATNNIAGADLKTAKKNNYSANDACTESSLTEKDNLLTAFLKNIGILNNKWDDW